MLSSAKYLIFALLVGSAFAAKKPLPSTHLPPDSPLRIGVTHRPETCPRKTKGGDRVSMHYAGTIYTTGKEFDSSIGRDTPFEFTLGAGQGASVVSPAASGVLFWDISVPRCWLLVLLLIPPVVCWQ